MAVNDSWEIPDPFIGPDGRRITSEKEWEGQREYLKKILAERMYGEMPPAPGNIQAEKIFEKELWDGTAVFQVYDLSFGPERKVHEKTAFIRTSDPEARPVPIVFCGGYLDEAIAKTIVASGFCIATPVMGDAAPDTPEYREGTLYQAYPEYSFKVIAMWAWLLSRVIDYIKTRDDVDPDHVVAAGHSRNGKAALCLAVFDDRVSISTAGGSGCGGIGSLRFTGGRQGENIGKAETLGGMITGSFPHWFLDSLIPYGAKEASEVFRENELPFDANFIGAAIAPRPMILVEGLDDTWANPFGTYLSWNASAEVYHFLHADEKCALHFREGGHALNLEDWKVLLDFCRVQLFGDKPETLYHTRAADEPALKRSWRAPGAENEEISSSAYPPVTPERIKAMQKMLDERWAFKEAGLETGIEKFIKMMIERAEKELTDETE